MKKKLVSIMLVAAMALSVVACGSSKGNSAKTDGTEAMASSVSKTPDNQISINLASEPQSIDPALNSAVDGGCMIVNSFAGLYTYDKDGKLITESVTDYSKKNILGEYATLDSFLRAWNSEEKKQAIIDELQERGVLLEALRQIAGNKDIDDFDLICHIAYDKAPLTKAERANNVRKRGYLYKYSGLAQEVLSALLDKYMNEGIQDIENIEILSNDPFRKFGTPMKIAKLFGGKSGYIQAIRDLQKEIYAA